mmetsp:Transcript_19464/g.38532  ORF Transcript_19464/g.38532 Transcript_19464/m.38532 type:complete len:206 (+) Transcript_19464:150-767(+)
MKRATSSGEWKTVRNDSNSPDNIMAYRVSIVPGKVSNSTGGRAEKDVLLVALDGIYVLLVALDAIAVLLVALDGITVLLVEFSACLLGKILYIIWPNINRKMIRINKNAATSQRMLFKHSTIVANFIDKMRIYSNSCSQISIHVTAAMPRYHLGLSCTNDPCIQNSTAIKMYVAKSMILDGFLTQNLVIFISRQAKPWEISRKTR